MNDLADTVIDFDKTYKKKKIKRGFKIALFLFVFFIISLFIYLFFTHKYFKIKDIIIVGNEITDSEVIMDSFNVSIGDNYYLSYLYEIENNIKGLNTVDDVVIKRENNVISITVIEKDILFSTPEITVVEGGIVLNKTFNLTSIYFDNFSEYSNQDVFIQEMDKVHNKSSESFNQISQISYVPTEVNENRLIVYMRDTNILYLNDFETSYYLSNYFNILDKLYSEIGIKYGEFHFDIGSEFKPYD